ncbi:MAG: PEGA domain-containing protein, partial [Deltaproteobacteria bacterium]|nr:PEGA domain-containing protein [Deltaproteobacteria bacterium]
MQGLLRVGGFVRIVYALGLLLVSSGSRTALAQDAAPAVLVVTASDAATSGAAIRIDGEPSGNVPVRKTLAPGRHLLQVGKRGFVTFSKWVDLVAGQVVTVPVALQSQAVNTGSLLITADVTGMPVYIDGQRRGGTPLVVDGLTEGDHEVEIRSPGEGYQPFLRI